MLRLPLPPPPSSSSFVSSRSPVVSPRQMFEESLPKETSGGKRCLGISSRSRRRNIRKFAESQEMQRRSGRRSGWLIVLCCLDSWCAISSYLCLAINNGHKVCSFIFPRTKRMRSLGEWENQGLPRFPANFPVSGCLLGRCPSPSV